MCYSRDARHGRISLGWLLRGRHFGALDYRLQVDQPLFDRIELVLQRVRLPASPAHALAFSAHARICTLPQQSRAHEVDQLTALRSTGSYERRQPQGAGAGTLKSS